jgi:hypothetical protein
MTSEEKIQLTFRNSVTIDKQTDTATFFCLLCEESISTAFPHREPLSGDALDIVEGHFVPADGFSRQCPVVKRDGLDVISILEWRKAKNALAERICWLPERPAKRSPGQ